MGYAVLRYQLLTCRTLANTLKSDTFHNFTFCLHPLEGILEKTWDLEHARFIQWCYCDYHLFHKKFPECEWKRVLIPVPIRYLPKHSGCINDRISKCNHQIIKRHPLFSGSWFPRHSQYRRRHHTIGCVSDIIQLWIHIRVHLLGNLLNAYLWAFASFVTDILD